MNRLQKLLCCEYPELTEVVVLESPFAQTTRDGSGIRQLQVGLSSTKLFVAADYPCPNPDPFCSGDPELEGLELLTVVPLESVNLSVFRRRTRNTIKAHFANDRILYFELSTRVKRQMFWNLWCERVRLLRPEVVSSTQSEISIGSTSSSVTNISKTRTICNADNQWQERDLFLGSKFGNWITHKKRLPSCSPHVPREAETESTMVLKRGDKMKVCHVNRFGAGVSENCSTSLYLPASFIAAQCQTMLLSEEPNKMMYLEEEAVCVWERSKTPRHPRRYGLATMPHLISGLGLWPLPPPQAAMVQLRRWSSEVNLLAGDLRPKLPKSLLLATVSAESLSWYSQKQAPPVLFWTPGLWYKPTPVDRSYRQQRQHLDNIKSSIEHEPAKTFWFKNKKNRSFWHGGWSDSQETGDKLQVLKRQLRIDIPLSSWDFDSTLIAYQITLIDRDLLIRLPYRELTVLVTERNSRNAPNFRAMVAFSNRLANLITTEIVRIDSVKMRARLIARWINVADKLLRLQDLQGMSSVLSGLQSPAVHRLSHTWEFLRQRHSSKYRRLTALMRLVRDPTSSQYSRLVTTVERTTPFLMSVEYIVAVLLGRTTDRVGILEAEKLVKRSSAAEYGLTETPLAREFLTKARYVEERDSFLLALRLEPPEKI